MSTSKFFAGALIGLVAGLLIAPEKGEEMREDIAETAQKWKKKIDRLTGKSAGELDALRETLGKEIEGLNDDVRKRILTILDETKASAQNMQQNFASAV